MSVLKQNRWFALAVGVTVAFAAVSLATPKGAALAAISDLTYLFLMLTVGITMMRNAWTTRGSGRRFWILMGSGYLLWTWDVLAWSYSCSEKRSLIPGSWMWFSFCI